jgi:hypothetical protein
MLGMRKVSAIGASYSIMGGNGIEGAVPVYERKK